MTNGEIIRQARLSKQMTQLALAAKIGVSLVVIQNIEKDKDSSTRILKKVCEELGLEIIVQHKETNVEENENDFIEEINAD